nr:zinc finger, CCHC-type [Tanacetum cinerariifolium]
MDESIQVSCIIDKLSHSWKYFKHTLKYLKEELTLIELGSHLRIEESLRVHDSDKSKGNNVAGPSVVNMVEHNNSSRYNDNKGKWKHHDTKVDPNKKLKVTCWKCRKPRHLKRDCKGGNVGNKGNGSCTKGSRDGSFNPMKGQNMFNKSLQIYYVTYVSKAYFVQVNDVAWWVDSRATVHVCKYRCWFKTYESLNDGSILHMKKESTALVHGHGCTGLRFSYGKVISLLNVLHVPNIRKNLVSGNKNYFVTFIGDASRVWGCRSVIRLPDPKLKTLDERGIECVFVGYAEHSKALRFYVIEPNDSVAINSIIESRDATFDKHRFLSVPRPSQRSLKDGTGNSSGSVVFKRVTEEDVAFWKEAINDEIDFIMGNNTCVLTDLPPGCRPLGCKWIFKRKLKMDVKTAFLNGEQEEEVYMNQHLGFIMPGNENKVDLTKEFASSRFSMKDMGEADVILGIRIKHKSNATGKEAEWLKYLLFEIPLWYKPMTPISIYCDSAATLAKAYSQMYNEKYRHLGVRHNMIREVIMNGVISIEFRAEAYVLQIILRMCLEHADKEDEVVNFLMVNFFENVLTRRVNKEEPPMYMLGFYHLKIMDFGYYNIYELDMDTWLYTKESVVKLQVLASSVVKLAIYRKIARRTPLRARLVRLTRSQELMEDQPLSADASPTALSPGYIVDFDSEKDEKDPKEEPADYPADRGDNNDNESSNDDDDDDDVEKDEEDKEEEEHIASADPSDISTDDLVPSS